MTVTIRAGGPADLGTLLTWFDEAVTWMVERGQPEQWGSKPWSQVPERVNRVEDLVWSGQMWVAEYDGAPAGALVISGQPPSWVPPVDEPELYVHMLITSRELAGRSIGSALLDHARAEAARAGISLLRVDCWAGADGKLVDYYRRNGFEPTVTFKVEQWQGQVLEQRIH